MTDLHPLAWICWLSAALIALSLTHNPLYLLLILLCVAIIGTLVQSGDQATPRLHPLRFGIVFVVLGAIFNALTVHYGDTVLFILPRWLPLVGGTITFEALVYGALNGLVLTGVLAAFNVLMAALPIQALLRLVPAAFYPVAVVVAVAVSFVPTTLRQITQIREAQAVRGHRVRGWRDWLPLWMPLLIGGLERALQLAEAMVARGFASNDAPHQQITDQALLVGGLVTLLVGWLLRLAWGFERTGIALMLLAVALVCVALWRAGRRVPRTHYRQQPWRTADSLVALACAIVTLVLLVPLPFVARDSLFFYPYPQIRPPAFNSILGIALLTLLAPAILLRRTPIAQPDRASS